jgi:hypothetical protein
MNHDRSHARRPTRAVDAAGSGASAYFTNTTRSLTSFLPTFVTSVRKAAPSSRGRCAGGGVHGVAATSPPGPLRAAARGRLWAALRSS